MAVHSWGSLWQWQKILFHCGNQAVVSIWGSGSTRAKETMALVYLLYYSRYNINVCIVHIPGASNKIADCLSCFQQDRFRQLVPLAIKYSTRQHPCMANPVLHRSLLQYHYLGVAPSACQTYQSGLNAFSKFCLSLASLHSCIISNLRIFLCSSISACLLQYTKSICDLVWESRA